MIKLEKTTVYGMEEAIRGMRNPMNSWDKSDSKTITATLKEEEVIPGVTATVYEPCNPYTDVGPNDHELMMKLAAGGPVHAKYRRMIAVYVDITAPFYWWKEFDTYKVGTVANSCSTMHKIHAKEFTMDDFSTEHLTGTSLAILKGLIEYLNQMRNVFVSEKVQDKKYWWQLIQLLPTSYNQKRTVMLNYEVLAGLYPMRKNHKLDEWHVFCDWIKSLPYSELITGVEATDDK